MCRHHRKERTSPTSDCGRLFFSSQQELEVRVSLSLFPITLLLLPKIKSLVCPFLTESEAESDAIWSFTSQVVVVIVAAVIVLLFNNKLFQEEKREWRETNFTLLSTSCVETKNIYMERMFLFAVSFFFLSCPPLVEEEETRDWGKNYSVIENWTLHRRTGSDSVLFFWCSPSFLLSSFLPHILFPW